MPRVAPVHPVQRPMAVQLREELERAKQTVEDAAGVHVSAFRAQDFSILAGNLWTLSRRSPRSASRSTRRSSRCVRRGTESPTGSLHRIGSGFRTTAPFSSAGRCLAGAEMADSGGGRWLLPSPTAGLAEACAPRDHGRTSPAGHLLPSVRVQPSGARRLSPECSDAASSFARARSRFVRTACPDTPAVGAVRAFRRRSDV
jgi:hypothetical protein